MLSIKGVMLLSLEDNGYRRHMAHQAFLAKVNAGTKTPDSNQEFTQLVEDKVRMEIAQLHVATTLRILRWQQYDLNDRSMIRYRELDGVFKTATGTNILLEVKASASKSSVKTGLMQLRKSVKIASCAVAQTVGILVVADLGEWFETFGQAASQPLSDYFAGMDLDLLDWPPSLSAEKTSGLVVSLVPGSTLVQWLFSECPE